ncbi:MAG: hypothetical protein K5837_02210 [Candidatus Saccharibacteria bacterium]|nr:hypothetical protein [Candidatus Saccharibacteria bacterium]
MEKITVKPVVAAIKNGDVEGLKGIFSEVGMRPGGNARAMHRDIYAASALGSAAVFAHVGKVSPAMAELLVEYLWGCVRQSMVWDYYLIARGADNDLDPELIPEKVREAIQQATYSDEAAKAIDEMDAASYDNMIAYLLKENIRVFDKRFVRNTFMYILKKEPIPMPLFFTLFAIAVEDSAQSSPFGMHDAGFRLGGIGILMNPSASLIDLLREMS